MISEVINLIIKVVTYLWPFRIVEPWQRAGYYYLGRWWKEMGPGLKVVCPFFTECRDVSTACHPVVSGRQDVTMLDGTTLTFDATAKMRVIDARKALNDTDDYHHSTVNDLGSILAEELATTDVDRLRPRRRGSLFKDLTKAVNDATSAYGVEVTEVRFSSFVLGVRTYRLLSDQLAVRTELEEARSTGKDDS